MKKTSFIGNHLSRIPHANIDRIGFYIALYGVAAVLLWIGAFKFHPDEANAISGIILSSPLVSWLYNVMDINQTSRVIGGVEIIAGVLLAAYPFSRKAAMVGGLIASCTFVATVSFILTTPGVLHTSSHQWQHPGISLIVWRIPDQGYRTARYIIVGCGPQWR